MTPTRWLAASNVTWLLAGVLAYATSISIVVGTALALVPAMPGLWALRAAALDDRPQTWLDRALSFAIAGWAMLAALVIIPYVASEEGLSLWTSRGFAGLGVAVASLAMLSWNFAVFRALSPDVRSAQMYGAFHVALLGVALYTFTQSDFDTTTFILRGQEITMPDPQLTAGIVAAPGLLWALVMWRVRPEA